MLSVSAIWDELGKMELFRAPLDIGHPAVKGARREGWGRGEVQGGVLMHGDTFVPTSDFHVVRSVCVGTGNGVLC